MSPVAAALLLTVTAAPLRPAAAADIDIGAVTAPAPASAPERAPSGDAAPAGPFAPVSTAPLTVETVLARFEEFDAELISLRGAFRQSLVMGRSGMRSEVRGTVAYSKPELLRIEHTAPERQTVVSDGKDIWIYRRSRDQVIQSDLEEWKRADPTLDNLMQFGSYAKMLRSYEVSLDTANARSELVLVPKALPEGRDAMELRLVLDTSTLFPVATVLEVGDVRVRTEFEDLEFNPKIDPKTFRFDPPAGAEIFRNFKPPRFSR